MKYELMLSELFSLWQKSWIIPAYCNNFTLSAFCKDFFSMAPVVTFTQANSQGCKILYLTRLLWFKKSPKHLKPTKFRNVIIWSEIPRLSSLYKHRFMDFKNTASRKVCIFLNVNRTKKKSINKSLSFSYFFPPAKHQKKPFDKKRSF